MKRGGFCQQCRKPWDEVHALDWLNDVLICREMSGPCRANHTWREHVAKSWEYKWISPHFWVKELQ